MNPIDYNNEFYERVEQFDWVSETEYWVEKNVPDGYIHAQVRVSNDHGDYVLKIDKEGIMMSCSCGCLGAEDFNFADFCEIEKEAKKLVRQTRLNDYWTQDYKNDFSQDRNWADVFREMESLNQNQERKIRMQLKQIKRSIDRAKDQIYNLEDLELRESFLDKLEEILGSD